MKKDSRTQTVAVRLTPEEKNILVQMCAQTDKTYSEMLRDLIIKEYNRDKLRYDGF